VRDLLQIGESPKPRVQTIGSEEWRIIRQIEEENSLCPDLAHERGQYADLPAAHGPGFALKIGWRTVCWSILAARREDLNANANQPKNDT
jgi:hypothetical protein